MRKREKREDREREQRGIEKETKRQFEEKEGLRDPPLLEFLDPTLRCSHCFFKYSGYRPVGSNFKPVRPWAWLMGVASWCGSHSLFYAFNTLKSIHIYI